MSHLQRLQHSARSLLCLWATLGLAIACGARADSIILSPVADNTIFMESGAESSGITEYGFVGRTQNGEVRRMLIRFDATPIPPGSVVTGATLRLTMTRTRGGSNSIGAFRLLESWGEQASISFGGGGRGGDALPGDATWTHRFFGTLPWTTVGGTFAPTASATTAVGGTGNYTWSSAGLASDVQAWVTDPNTNHGWELIGGETGGITAKRFETRESISLASRPILTVTFTPPANTGACCTPDGVCIIRTAAECSSISGTFRGIGTTCNPSPCPPPLGACCLPTGLCTQLTQAQCTSQQGTYRGNNTPCTNIQCPIVLTPFVDALPIPPVAQPVSGTVGGAAHYSIAMTEFTHRAHRDLPLTRVWGYAGSWPGPTIIARRGMPVTVDWINNLRNAGGSLRTTHLLPVDTCVHGPDTTGQAPLTVVHLHGARTTPESDGNPDAAFPPGQQAPTYTYPNDQRASTLWYHDHALGLTRLNVYAGLAGAYVIRDSVDDALNLPRNQFDVPLVIQDRSFNPDGSLRYPADWHEHFFGDFLLANGKVAPFMNVAQGKYRFRVVNGCNARTLTLALSDGNPFRQIASDQGLLARNISMTSITLAPGERAELIFDFGIYPVGAEVMLVNSAPAPFPGTPGEGVVPNVMKFNVQDAIGFGFNIPTNLASVPRTPESQAVLSRQFTLRTMPSAACGQDIWTINDLHWDDITEFPRFGDTEIWSFINRSGVNHPMHIHLVSFQILDTQPFEIQNGQVVTTGPRVPPASKDAGWKDTVNVMPLTIARVIARFDGYAGTFPYHCHTLEHEDNEMMRQFTVVCPPINFDSSPANLTACRGGPAQFSVALAPGGLGGETFRWRRNGVPLADGPTPAGSVISGSGTATLTISGARVTDAGAFDVVVTSACRSETSAAATLAVCAVDFNCDGELNPDDLGDFINCYFSVPPCPLGDINEDGQIDPDDLGDYINLYFGGGGC